jgi:fumarate reductase subunit D
MLTGLARAYFGLGEAERALATAEQAVRVCEQAGTRAWECGALLALARLPISRVYLFVLIAVPLFHWAHRFRYTLYDGLQLKHLSRPIAALCYGAAAVGTVLAAHTIWSL